MLINEIQYQGFDFSKDLILKILILVLYQDHYFKWWRVLVDQSNDFFSQNSKMC